MPHKTSKCGARFQKKFVERIFSQLGERRRVAGRRLSGRSDTPVGDLTGESPPLLIL
jgi:hypothetical protein